MTDEKRNLSDGDDPSVEGELSPRGEDLTSRNLTEAEEYDVVDPEAEELTTPDDVVDKTPELDIASRCARVPRKLTPWTGSPQLLLLPSLLALGRSAS